MSKSPASHMSEVRASHPSHHIKRPRFDLIVNLPEPLRPTFHRVVTFAEVHVQEGKPTGPPGRVAAGQFIWSDFRDAITNRTNSDMAFDQIQSTTLRASQDSPHPKADIAAKVIAFIADSFPAVSREELAKHVKRGFGESAEEVSNSDPASMRLDSEAAGVVLNKIEWEYRFIYGYPIADQADHFDALVATVKYQDEVVKKPGILGPIGASIVHKCSADVIAMQTVVSKEFSGEFNIA